MQLVQQGQPFSFNYTDSNQRSDLYVAFSVYDVTDPLTPALVDTVIGVYSNFGSYMGSFTGTQNTRYLVIGLVYTDNTYTIVDTSASPTSDVYWVLSGAQVIVCGFSYASYGFTTTLNLRASVYNVTTGSPVFDSNQPMYHIANGIYYGDFQGVFGQTYGILSVVYTDNSFSTVDVNYAPGSESFDTISLTVDILVMGQAHLIGQGQGQKGIVNVNPPIHFTQGDDATLQLIAVDADGNPVDLTDATFATQIQGPNGVGPVTFPNSQHTANPDQVTYRGYFTLALSESDTASCGIGNHKEILTTITQDASSVDFRGFNALQVYAPTPFE